MHRYGLSKTVVFVLYHGPELCLECGYASYVAHYRSPWIPIALVIGSMLPALGSLLMLRTFEKDVGAG